jgi:2-keto-4-pentenoate hydratase/2-oxohepta-3-ene-1,7-dioic acid hydratase in catechol pathway
MRIVRFQSGDQSQPVWGWVEGDRIGRLDGSPFEAFRREKADIDLGRIRLFPPATPEKIICVERNYAAHAADHDSQVPEVPLIFLKPCSALIGPDETVLLPPQSERVEHEGELAVVIGMAGRWISPDHAIDHILGYTIANDISARDLQFSDGQWTRAKGFDTFCPLGPWIETDFDPTDALITCSVNGQMRQMASTRDMVFPVNQIVAFVSSVMTLKPGDLLLSGTPAGVGPLADGDLVTVEIEHIGTLSNPVKNDRRHP